jgi:hypothetical protein
VQPHTHQHHPINLCYMHPFVRCASHVQSEQSLLTQGQELHVSPACDQVQGNRIQHVFEVSSRASGWSISVCGVFLQTTPVHSFVDGSDSWPSAGLSGLTPCASL